MKIVELLDKAMKTGDIIYVSGWALGMRYNKDNDCFIIKARTLATLVVR